MTLRKQYRAMLDERLRPSVVDVPGFDPHTIAVRLLTDAQITEAKIEAFRVIDERCKEAGVSPSALNAVDAEVYDRERVVQIIARAFVSAEHAEKDFDDPEPAFTATMVRSMDAIAVQELFDAYLAFQDTRAFRQNLTAAQIDEIAESLTKPGNEAALALLTDEQLRALAVALAKRRE